MAGPSLLKGMPNPFEAVRYHSLLVERSSLPACLEITAETATTFYVDHVRFVKGIFNVYRDAGIPAKSRLTNWASGAAVFNAHYTDGAAPEGYECYQATSAVSAGWGVVMTNGTLDMTIGGMSIPYDLRSNGVGPQSTPGPYYFNGAATLPR